MDCGWDIPSLCKGANATEVFSIFPRAIDKTVALYITLRNAGKKKTTKKKPTLFAARKGKAEAGDTNVYFTITNEDNAFCQQQ